MEKIDLNTLTPDQRQSMLAELRAQEVIEKAQKESNIETYKELVSQVVTDNFPRLHAISGELASHKRAIRDSFSAVLEMKAELYGVKEKQRSHQFMNEAGTHRISIGYYVVDNYDDTVNSGIAKVTDYIHSMARDEQSSILVDTVLKLLSKDAKGTLKASRVLQLQQMAEKSGDAEFIDGVKIIRDAYRPTESKSFIKAEYRDGNGSWVSVPLGMTEAK